MSIQSGLAIEEGQTDSKEEQDVAPVREEFQHRVSCNDEFWRGKVVAIGKRDVVRDPIQAGQEIKDYSWKEDGERCSESTSKYEGNKAESNLCQEQEGEYAKYGEVALNRVRKKFVVKFRLSGRRRIVHVPFQEV